MKINLFIVVMLVIIALPLFSSALTCDYKDNPQLEILRDDIEWVCYTGEDYCLSYVKYEDRLLQVNPRPEEVEGIGVIDKYEADDGIVRVFFTKKNLRADTNFTFGVRCGDESFEDDVYPEYKNIYIVQDQMLRAKDNTSTILLVVVISVLVIIILGLFVRYFKR